MTPIPLYISVLFDITVLLFIGMAYRASHRSIYFLIGLLLLGGTQLILGVRGFYDKRDAVPPRLLFLILPSLIAILVFFIAPKGRVFIDSMGKKTLTLLHILRIPVEFVLYGLAVYKAVPFLITFEGRNFDLLSGISAPFVWYFGFIKPKLSRFVLIAWNVVCLGLLLNVVFYAVLSAPSPFQRFSLDQPNLAIQAVPFLLLPALIVPLVLLAHLVTIRQLIRTSNNPVL
jgi:hypothetical protein